MEQDFAFNIFNNLDNDCDNNASSSNNEPSIYIFGYGSLVWNPGFEYSKCITGCESFVKWFDFKTDVLMTIFFLLISTDIRGYVRRFWQGNVTHRGTVDKVNE
jgi:glutathione-specific gamma-glutamylcyclotransferase